MGEMARHGNAAVSEQMSDMGSSDDSSTRSDESGEPTTPLSGAVRSPSGREGHATEANGGNDQIERLPFPAAAPEQRDGAPCASEEPKAVTERDADTRVLESRSGEPKEGEGGIPATTAAAGAQHNSDVQAQPVAAGSGARVVSVRLEMPGGAEDDSGPLPCGWSLQPQNERAIDLAQGDQQTSSPVRVVFAPPRLSPPSQLSGAQHRAASRGAVGAGASDRREASQGYPSPRVGRVRPSTRRGSTGEYIPAEVPRRDANVW